MDAVQIKMGKGPRAAVVVDNGKGWAGNRVRAAKALCNALAERGFASAQPAGKGNQAAGGKLCGKAAAQATVSSREWVIYSSIQQALLKISG